ncbi:hypothetical protein [Crassaminicella profunda]|uniref:hypothetical protein n=1 Tax=Crassaminicella profunda TaxID=1286698 RepID=UPI001CA74E34|nr:hypothetical protein [Crassaminicella profunda]QZY56646.1 hypothetical protein K7H06_06925 [Crassaminicella profunda]
MYSYGKIEANKNTAREVIKMTYDELLTQITQEQKNKAINTVLENTTLELQQHGNEVKSRPQYIEALRSTISSILFHNNREKIALTNLPTGCGKSTAVVNGISYLQSEDTSYIENIDYIRGTIILRLQTDDCDKTAEAINKKVGKEVAYAFHSKANDAGIKKNWIKPNDLQKYPVVVLTHEGLLSLLSRGSSSRITNWTNANGEVFERRRLIIDEEIANVKIVDVTYQDIMDIEYVFAEAEDKEVFKLYNKFVKELKEKFSEETKKKVNTLIFETFKYDEPTDETLAKYLDKNRYYEELNKYRKLSSLLRNGGYVNARNAKDGQVKKFITYSKVDLGTDFYITQLDATSDINHLYKINPNFEKIGLPSVKKYSNTNVHVYTGFTGSKANIEKHTKQTVEDIDKFPSNTEIRNFIDALIIDVIDKTQYKEKILVVFNTMEIEKIFNERLNAIAFDTINEKCYVYGKIKDKIKTAHFGELTGKNDWNDYDTCFMIGLPFYSYNHYPLYHLANEDKEKINIKVVYDEVTMRNDVGARRYVDENFEKVRIGLVASSVVQAMNRIKCRNINKDGNTPITDIYIINRDKKIDHLIRVAMPEVNILYDWKIKYNPKLIEENSEDKKTKEEPVDRLINFLKGLLYDANEINKLREEGHIDEKGIKFAYLKKMIKGLSNQNTWKKTIKHLKLIEFCKENNLEIKYRHIGI